MYSSHIFGLLSVLGICVILPVSIVFLSLRSKMVSEKNRKDIILAALEKDASIDIEELVRKMNTPDRLLKEKLLKKLLWGMLTFFLGVGLIGFGIYLAVANVGGTDDPQTAICFGLIFVAVGIAFLANYHIGRKMLAKEMEAEERNLQQA